MGDPISSNQTKLVAQVESKNVDFLGRVLNPSSPSSSWCHRLLCGRVAKSPAAQDSDLLSVTLLARTTILGPSGSTITKINKQMSPRSSCDSFRLLEEAKNDSATRFAVRFVEVAIYDHFPHPDFWLVSPDSRLRVARLQTYPRGLCLKWRTPLLYSATMWPFPRSLYL
jgi:hypothetical protein